ncbi:cytidine deaminase [Rubellimicrobium arenae]|uniref:cytidine deaminase n=1 Tax=Rubellimicrobium arenae TaxID=2817372 RepID=UPI001B3155F2|nr:cytidine deaminase [Rubellimicrobium arenae]
MSRNPFRADLEVPSRLARQEGEAIRAAAAEVLSGGAIPGPAAAALRDRFGLGPDDLLLHLLPLARGIARPPVSGFHVGAVGRAAGSGDLILGGNLEFPGAALHQTIHGEGFVAIRAWQRGQSLDTLAISEAHPCAHCRQVLTEFASSGSLVLIDPLGHRLTMEQLYPWPFDPGYLDQPGARPHQGTDAGLRAPAGLPQEVAARLAEAGRQAHAPYSGCPAALVLETALGLFAGGNLESVAFNPTLTPGQTAMVALIAAGGDPTSITRAWLAQRTGGPVDLTRSVAELLAAVSPRAELSVHAWPD